MKLVMDEKLKHRLVGIAVIISICAIFAPAMLKKSSQQRFDDAMTVSVKLPPKPIVPQVVVPNQEKMFERVKVAHIAIPTTEVEAKPISRIAKAEPLRTVDKKTVTESDAIAIELSKNESLTEKQTPILTPIAKEKTKVISMLPLSTKSVPSKPTPTLKVKAVKKEIKNAYVVQLATFSQQVNAISLINKLKAKGYKAILNKTTVKNAVVYKIFVGAGDEKTKAQQLQQQLASITHLKGFLVPSTGIS